jgi:hypothetical protein
MSAPLVVNTRDGVCWTRRTVTSGGIALYAPESVKTCPDFVMATEAELAEHGIVGSAYALPMPVGPGPVVRPLALDEAQVDALAASGNRAVNDLVHEDLCACDAWPEKCLSSGGFFQGYWDWGYLETAIPAVLGLWESMRGGELERLRARVAELEAEREKLVRWHGEDSKTINRLVARVERRQAELVALRNDALSMRGSLAPADGSRKVPFELGETLAPAVDWLIGRVAELEARIVELGATPERPAPYVATPEAHAQMRESLTRYFAGETEPDGGDVR